MILFHPYVHSVLPCLVGAMKQNGSFAALAERIQLGLDLLDTGSQVLNLGVKLHNRRFMSVSRGWCCRRICHNAVAPVGAQDDAFALERFNRAARRHMRNAEPIGERSRRRQPVSDGQFATLDGTSKLLGDVRDCQGLSL